MKTTIIRHLVFASVASLIAFTSVAQINTTEQVAYEPGSSSALNTAYLKLDLSTLKNYVNSEKANRKIVRYVSKHFQNADNVAWGKLENNVLAVFSSADTKTRALFNKNGNVIYTIVYSDEKLLPHYYSKMLHNIYDDYKISQVAKVNEDIREVWVVNLESPKKLLTVRIEGDQPEEVEKFQKSR